MTITREEAKNYLIHLSYLLGTTAVEDLAEKDGERMRAAIEVLEHPPYYKFSKSFIEEDGNDHIQM